MTARLTTAQRAALTKLADGEWHSLNGSDFKWFAVESMTRLGLIERDIIQPSTPGRDYSYLFRMTDAGRSALGAPP